MSIIIRALVMALAVGAAGAAARDSVHHLPLQAVLDDPAVMQQIGNIKFFFGDAPAPAGTDLGEFVTNKKTNAFGKPDEEACRWVMLSALYQLRDKAIELGADTVVNVQSYYKKVAFNSTTQYECHAGALMAGVALKASFRKTK